MARFIQVDYPTNHAGLARISNGFASIGTALRNFDGARGTATLLLAALVSALIVVANELVTTWTEGHLLAAWIVAWLVGFAGLALFATPARHAAGRVRRGLQAWSVARQQAAEDDKLWQVALSDARVMADLSRAMSSAAHDLRKMY